MTRDKIAAVYDYLGEEFQDSGIEDRFDAARDARLFTITTGKFTRTVVIKRDFFENNTVQTVRNVLKGFLLAEHIRECDFPLVVTAAGLSD